MLLRTWFCCCLILTFRSSHGADNTVSVSVYSKIAGQRLTGGAQRVPAAPVECVFGAHTFLAQRRRTRAIVVLVLGARSSPATTMS
uniref:Putative secreted protein n=1 Tax=Anopheles darlingi TaxID=43151 RepID=A0A2M4D9D0_ANODA